MRSHVGRGERRVLESAKRWATCSGFSSRAMWFQSQGRHLNAALIISHLSPPLFSDGPDTVATGCTCMPCHIVQFDVVRCVVAHQDIYILGAPSWPLHRWKYVQVMGWMYRVNQHEQGNDRDRWGCPPVTYLGCTLHGRSIEGHRFGCIVIDISGCSGRVYISRMARTYPCCVANACMGIALCAGIEKEGSCLRKGRLHLMPKSTDRPKAHEKLGSFYTGAREHVVKRTARNAMQVVEGSCHWVATCI